jgi:hypothetical protein
LITNYVDFVKNAKQNKTTGNNITLSPAFQDPLCAKSKLTANNNNNNTPTKFINHYNKDNEQNTQNCVVTSIRRRLFVLQQKQNECLSIQSVQNKQLLFLRLSLSSVSSPSSMKVIGKHDVKSKRIDPKTLTHLVIIVVIVVVIISLFATVVLHIQNKQNITIQYSRVALVAINLFVVCIVVVVLSRCKLSQSL